MKHLFLSFVFCLSVLQAFGESLYSKELFISSHGDSLNYRLMEPDRSAQLKRYPLVIFMHGAGERGSDNELQLTHGSRMFENPVVRDQFPAYVIFPQCPERGYWAFNERPASFNPELMPILAEPTGLITSVKELITQYMSRPDIDTKCVYIIGMSMGAMATYDLTIRYPELFTAAIPICGTVNPQRITTKNDIQYRIFHGDNDDVVPVSGSREAYKALKRVGCSVEYTEFPGVNHGSWNNAFNVPDFFCWLFSQRKK